MITMLQDKNITPAIQWDIKKLTLLDQRQLPFNEQYINYRTAPKVAEAISNMVVRGAPAIGITAAYAVVLSAISHDMAEDKILADIEVLSKSRPTAVNLFWALNKMQTALLAGKDLAYLCKLAEQIHIQDIKNNQKMGKIGAEYIKNKSTVLTHCNAGALATGGYGTALGVIRSAHDDAKLKQVYVDETRPWLQGSRLTAWELEKYGIKTRILTDGAAAWLMQQHKVDWLIVGADRIAANGDVANKIGTYAATISAKYHKVKVMVVAPTSTIDFSLKSGKDIPLETRDESEIFKFADCEVAPDDYNAWNQVFDVTPASLIDVLITEKAAIENPTTNKIL